MLLIRRLEGFYGTKFSAHVPIEWCLRQYMVTGSKKVIDWIKNGYFKSYARRHLLQDKIEGNFCYKATLLKLLYHNYTSL